MDAGGAIGGDPLTLSSEVARDFLQSAKFVWYQRFPLTRDVYTPGEHDISWALQWCGIPNDLKGMTVLDIGTSNGGVAFEMERRGAARVVATDILPPSHFGFDQLKELLGSKVEFIQASIYELPEVINEQFDIVFFLGVLYHLRHPLLALDQLRSVTRGCAFIESEVADGDLRPSAHISNLSVTRFFRTDDMAGDSSNWFAPNIKCLLEWCWSCGLRPTLLKAWPNDAPKRCLVKAERVEGEPEYRLISYERPIHVKVD